MSWSTLKKVAEDKLGPANYNKCTQRQGVFSVTVPKLVLKELSAISSI